MAKAKKKKPEETLYGKPDKRTPAERLGKLVPIFGRIGEAMGGKKKKTTKKR